IMDGYVSYRYFSNDMTLTYAFSPIIIGIMGMFASFSSGFFKAESTVSTLRIDMTTCESVLNSQPHLWRSYAEIISFAFQRLQLRDMTLTKKKTHDIVCSILIELINQPSIVRENITAAQYILDRLPISRSLVMDIISGLKRTNKIEVSKGYLLNVIDL
ncbi:helix-turn-helix domain-containing protein, partial [Enterobacter cloacae complex sp. P4RS]|uniref:helix-turn-helix domain-containing protein n=1 Tax=Enterobacter cloacae complex sp. P4RS TaxID=2779590 RepID=UPI0018734766